MDFRNLKDHFIQCVCPLRVLIGFPGRNNRFSNDHSQTIKSKCHNCTFYVMHSTVFVSITSTTTTTMTENQQMKYFSSKIATYFYNSDTGGSWHKESFLFFFCSFKNVKHLNSDSFEFKSNGRTSATVYSTIKIYMAMQLHLVACLHFQVYYNSVISFYFSWHIPFEMCTHNTLNGLFLCRLNATSCFVMHWISFHFK